MTTCKRPLSKTEPTFYVGSRRMSEDVIVKDGYVMMILHDEDPDPPDEDFSVFLGEVNHRVRLGRPGWCTANEFIPWAEGLWGRYNWLLKKHGVTIPPDAWRLSDDRDEQEAMDLYQEYLSHHEATEAEQPNTYEVFPVRYYPGHYDNGGLVMARTFGEWDGEVMRDEPHAYVFVQVPRNQIHRLTWEVEHSVEELAESCLARWNQYLSNDFYRIYVAKLPDDWKDQCCIDIFELEDVGDGWCGGIYTKKAAEAECDEIIAWHRRKAS